MVDAIIKTSSEWLENFTRIEQRIQRACDQAGRKRNEITLVAVSKLQPVEKIVLAYNNGQRLFGENYVQEAQRKKEALSDKLDLKLHLIGPLQKNKVKKAIGLFEVIQSVDTVLLAELIAKQAEQKGFLQKIFLQINVSAEESKSGMLMGDFTRASKELLKFPALRIEGLMCIGSWDAESVEDLRQRRINEYQQMNLLRDQLEQLTGETCLLSMGMSDDFELAIEYGANIIRIGTALFGERTK